MSRWKEIAKGMGRHRDDGGTSLQGHKDHPEDGTVKIYRCPMKCEGDKTYTEPGKCPVCGMFLAPVEAGSHKH